MLDTCLLLSLAGMTKFALEGSDARPGYTSGMVPSVEELSFVPKEAFADVGGYCERSEGERLMTLLGEGDARPLSSALMLQQSSE